MNKTAYILMIGLITILSLNSCKTTLELATREVDNKCDIEKIQIPNEMIFQGNRDIVKARGVTGVKIERYYSAVAHAGNLRDCGQSLYNENKVLRRELKCQIWQLERVYSNFIVFPYFHKMEKCPFDEVKIKVEE